MFVDNIGTTKTQRNKKGRRNYGRTIQVAGQEKLTVYNASIEK
jgi:hypothetical protein